MSAQWPPPDDLILKNEVVSLAKYRAVDGPDLRHSLASPEVWAHIPVSPSGPEDWDEYAASGVETGRWPFVVRLLSPVKSLTVGSAVGSTSYYDVGAAHLHLSIGYTTYQPEVWGTAVNPSCKLLLLQYAFEVLGMQRVQLKTDNLNLRSQAAMEKIGATREGVLRQHMRRYDGTMRDSVVYSIVASEWPRVDQLLQAAIRSALPN